VKRLKVSEDKGRREDVRQRIGGKRGPACRAGEGQAYAEAHGEFESKCPGSISPDQAMGIAVEVLGREFV
jgi:hypothetical protein